MVFPQERFYNSAHLSSYAHDGTATNHIVQNVMPSLGAFPGNPALSLQFAQLTAANNNAWAIAWNETVNDFIRQPRSSRVRCVCIWNWSSSATPLIFKTIRRAGRSRRDLFRSKYSRKGLCGPVLRRQFDDEFIEYSATTTAGVTQISPVAVVADPTTVAAGSVSALGDGRIESATTTFSIQIRHHKTILRSSICARPASTLMTIL